MSEEAEAIRKAVSKLTGAEYEFQAPSSDFPPSNQGVSWLLVSRVPLRGRSTTLAPIMWEDRTGMLYVESIELGRTSDWIYEMYGERGAQKSADLETEFSKGYAKDVLKKHFPRVHEKLLQYEHVLSGVSSKQLVNLQLEYSRTGFMITFYVLAKIDVGAMESQRKIEKIKLSIDAIKEAISEIDKYEEERTKSAD